MSHLPSKGHPRWFEVHVYGYAKHSFPLAQWSSSVVVTSLADSRAYKATQVRELHKLDSFVSVYFDEVVVDFWAPFCFACTLLVATATRGQRQRRLFSSYRLSQLCPVL